MILSGKKIVLRTVLPSDTDLIFKWENDKANWEVSGTKKPFTKKEIKDFIANQKDIYLDKQLRLMICISPIPPLPDSPTEKKKRRKEETEKRGEVGCIDLFAFNEPNLKAGIGILIDKKHRKKGYASESLALLIRYSFEILNVTELFCTISEANESSLKLFKKHKFKVIGKKNNICSLQLLNK